MATGTKSLPTDSPVPYFQHLERGHVSEGVPSDIGSPEGAFHGSVQMLPHHANFKQERLSAYTCLND